MRTNRERQRVAGLDGIRGLAALYVVLNHIFLRAFPGYPVNSAPAWAAWFIYGRFAVVVFIVLSGFSLALAPARDGWRLGGISRFAQRRAWRILPAYWAALLFSLAMTWFVVAQPGWPVPNGSSVLVNGLLLQDVVTVPSPNRAFWSIAIEAQLYVALPLLLLVCRRVSAVAMAGAVAVVVVSVGVVGELNQSVGSLVTQLTPDLAVLFAVGILAAGIVVAQAAERVLAVALAGGGLRRARDRDGRPAGSVWTIDHLFWVDLALGPVVGCLLVAVAGGRPAPLVGVLESRPLRSLGSFSYSLYLTHAPIVIAIYYGLVAGRVPPGVPTFLVLVAVVVPVTIVVARLFAAAFELPFQRHRGWPARLRREQIVEVGPDVRGEQVGLFGRGEVPAAREHRPAADVVQALEQLARRFTLRHELVREDRHRGGGTAPGRPGRSAGCASGCRSSPASTR